MNLHGVPGLSIDLTRMEETRVCVMADGNRFKQAADFFGDTPDGNPTILTQVAKDAAWGNLGSLVLLYTRTAAFRNMYFQRHGRSLAFTFAIEGGR